MNNSMVMKVNYSTAAGPWFESLYDSPAPLGMDNDGNPVYEDPRSRKAIVNKVNKQGTAATGYNRNSRQPWTINASAYDSYNMRWFNSTTINNVTVFNKYIFEKIRKMNKDLDNELSGYFGDSVLPDTLSKYVNMYYQFFGSVDTQPKATYLTQTMPMSQPTGKLYYTDFISKETNAAWMSNSCALHLIGTPEDVEELSMFPGLIVREVSDETHSFIKDNIGASILHTQNQLIEYKLDSYYSEVPKWWTNPTSIKMFVEKPEITGIYDQPYSECPDFQDPKTMDTINPYYEQQINPDERVYKIYIQMSNDLITTAYERSNFFIDIRNSKKKMSIKNFIEYLS